MGIRAVLFDIGHVLVDLTGADVIRSFSKGRLDVADIQRSWPDIDAVRAFESGKCDQQEFARGVIRHYGLDVSAERLVEGIAAAVAGKYAGVDAFLSALKGAYPISCLTNTNPIQWPIIAGLLDAESLFDHAIVSYEVGLMKPDARIYRHAIESVGFRPAEILFVDDNAENIRSGLACGLNCRRAEGFAEAKHVIEEALHGSA